jgi:DNA invertase Pin-like site-specific DNA recombinase
VKSTLQGFAEFMNPSIAYRDVACGATRNRPALDQLMKDARARKFDVVVVYRYDRFARSLHHLVSALEEFRALGIEFVSHHESLDTTTPNGRLVFGIMASIAGIRARAHPGADPVRDRRQAGRWRRLWPA